MAYTNDRTLRKQLHTELIDTADIPCAKCHSRDNREIHRIVPGHDGGEYTQDNVMVVCRECHLKHFHRLSKFRVGDIVMLNGRTPEFLDMPIHRPRTIISVRYDRQRQCNYYTLGSNGMGSNEGMGNPLDGYTDYEFRSYQLVKYEPRPYTRHNEQISCEARIAVLRQAHEVIYSELEKVG
jgi:hypothetical protein